MFDVHLFLFSIKLAASQASDWAEPWNRKQITNNE